MEDEAAGASYGIHQNRWFVETGHSTGHGIVLTASDPSHYVPSPIVCAGYATQTKSSIISIGLTIHNTPVELREKLAVPEAEWPRAIEELCAYPHIEEAGILSTCNRLELYVVAVSWHRGVREVGIRSQTSPASLATSSGLQPHLLELTSSSHTRASLPVPSKSGGAPCRRLDTASASSSCACITVHFLLHAAITLSMRLKSCTASSHSVF